LAGHYWSRAGLLGIDNRQVLTPPRSTISTQASASRLPASRRGILEVHSRRRFEVFQGEIREELGKEDAGVIHEAVDRTELGSLRYSWLDVSFAHAVFWSRASLFGSDLAPKEVGISLDCTSQTGLFLFAQAVQQRGIDVDGTLRQDGALPGSDNATIDKNVRGEAMADGREERGIGRSAAISVCHRVLIEGRQQ
jgi:hypothetical protein